MVYLLLPCEASPFYIIVSHSNDTSSVQDQLHLLDPKSDVRLHIAWMINHHENTVLRKAPSSIPLISGDVEQQNLS